eukprot:TRINITY_DN4839_c0_g1_i4.p1 TRINITY_DN4839_c0_g1~~TRINITY_DN4839_c0_g1_i4.p1  ORF type:complete len:560 (-),score=37.92 TRINITY_DN4839_c0_g1_i4:1081-2760(-)
MLINNTKTCSLIPKYFKNSYQRPRKVCWSRRETVCSLQNKTQATDVVIIGGGVGGLSCAAVLAYYGVDVIVCEAHNIPGGAAHSWTRNGYHFDSGTSVFFGLGPQPGGNPSTNPLQSVLDLVGEQVETVNYTEDKTCLLWPEGTFRTFIGSRKFSEAIGKLYGSTARTEWDAFQNVCLQNAKALQEIHPMALRYDPAVAFTVALRNPQKLVKFLSSNISEVGQSTFSELIDMIVTDEKLRSFLNMLCQATCGLKSDEIYSSYMIQAFNELYQPNVKLQYPKGGTQSLVDALVRGINKHGGKVLLQSPVQKVIVNNDKNNTAKIVQLRNGQQFVAKLAVVSNASAWDTLKLLPDNQVDKKYVQLVNSMEMNESFLHLHLGFDGEGLENQLPLHYFFFDPALVDDNGWPVITIPSAIDDSLAPSGCHTMHAYITEPYHVWQGLQRGSQEYEQLKQERVKVLWELIERVIPDIRDRVKIKMIGTPLTHERFLRRYKGTYGPKNILKINRLPTPQKPLRNLYCCGDSTFPGVGTPAVAASGMWVANSLVPVWKHWKAMDALGV